MIHRKPTPLSSRNQIVNISKNLYHYVLKEAGKPFNPDIPWLTDSERPLLDESLEKKSIVASSEPAAQLIGQFLLQSTIMSPTSFVIEFEDVLPAKASLLAQQLRQALLNAHPSISVDMVRSDPNAMHFGDVLSVTLDPVAITALAGCLGVWLRNRGTITLKKPGGEILIKNVTSRQHLDIAKLLETLNSGNVTPKA
jgi:hypothetical protein